MCRSANGQTGDHSMKLYDMHLEGLVEVYVNIVRKTRKCSSTMYLRNGLWNQSTAMQSCAAPTDRSHQSSQY